jgi:hypothetical protein
MSKLRNEEECSIDTIFIVEGLVEHPPDQFMLL